MSKIKMDSYPKFDSLKNQVEELIPSYLDNLKESGLKEFTFAKGILKKIKKDHPEIYDDMPSSVKRAIHTRLGKEFSKKVDDGLIDGVAKANVNTHNHKNPHVDSMNHKKYVFLCEECDENE